ncbi:MAG: DUF362 domain-containing protein [Synergistaceae bacterium]|jgi:uncharacterized Fe-S center protein|nr:DUF362 domain-containing protein [Synergistaceae bacterium]
MSKSKVYFTDMRCKAQTNLLEKLRRLIDEAGIGKIDFRQKYTAIKIHFGEPGNLAYLRPSFARVVAGRVKELGGMPFLTDCNTLYVGRRNNALVHLEAAYENGYSPFSAGCHVIIADGLKGTDSVEVPVSGGRYVRTADIGRAIMDADVIISLNHFKCHECTGIGGAVKNIGMGSGSRSGKMKMHSDGKPEVDPDACVGCRKCAAFCAQGAFVYNGGRASIDHGRCVGCGFCIGSCNFNAIYNPSASSNDILSCKMAEYAKAVLDGRPSFHVTVVNQVSPYCDCHSENDTAIVPDIGIFAGFDPVALDKACADAVNAAPPIKNSILSERNLTGDCFTDIHPETNWMAQINHGAKIGLGSGDYELVTIN